ncbi:MAG: hypothetical protein ONB12_11150 [candidate division KSB1 bacterium]|nr:hypothetical protein [candidate division KSB1 bacterium]
MEYKVCPLLMRVGPRYPGLLDPSAAKDKRLTAQYQCLRTVSALGPDFNAVSPQECTPQRSCFKRDTD